MKIEKSKNKRSVRERGITLIALVITIIILLILAGVTLGATLGENGLFKRAKGAVEVYDKSSEREALSLSVVSYQMGKANNENEEEGKIGITLHSRNIENSAIWDIVTENNSNTTYGDGWNYVEEGTNIEGYGSARHKWVVNYETGDIIELDSSSVHSSVGDTIVSPENLIFSLDSANFDLGTSPFGPNTQLYKCEKNLDDASDDTKQRWEEGIKDDNWADDEQCYDRKTAEPTEFFDEKSHGFEFTGHNYLEVVKNETFDIKNRNNN